MALFRQQALDAQHQNSLGTVIISRPIHSDLLFILVLIVFVSLMTFLSVGHYNQKETVVGVIEPRAGILLTKAPRDGVIQSVFVEEGENVIEGQPLYQISSHQYLASGDVSFNTHLAQLTKQHDIYSELQKSSTLQLTLLRNSTRLRIESLNRQLKLIQKNESFLIKKLAISQSELVQHDHLNSKQLVSLTFINKSNEKLIGIKQQVTDNQSLQVINQQNTDNLGFELERQVQRLNDSIQEIALKKIHLEQRIHDLRLANTLLVKAPIAGKVSSLNLEVGQSVNAQEYSLSLIPNNPELVAKLFLPTRSIGFVHQGSEVNLKLDAFPYQKFGVVNAIIETLALNTLPGNTSHHTLKFNEPVYKSIATLNSQTLQVKGQSLLLQAGMLVRAEVIISRRSILEWLFEPIIAAVE